MYMPTGTTFTMCATIGYTIQAIVFLDTLFTVFGNGNFLTFPWTIGFLYNLAWGHCLDPYLQSCTSGWQFSERELREMMMKRAFGGGGIHGGRIVGRWRIVRRMRIDRRRTIRRTIVRRRIVGRGIVGRRIVRWRG
jgi:hypothetical protein